MLDDKFQGFDAQQRRTPRVIFSDGTVAVFRTTGLSGGYTIDLNSPSHSKNWKVHVR